VHLFCDWPKVGQNDQLTLYLRAVNLYFTNFNKIEIIFLTNLFKDHVQLSSFQIFGNPLIPLAQVFSLKIVLPISDLKSISSTFYKQLLSQYSFFLTWQNGVLCPSWLWSWELQHQFEFRKSIFFHVHFSVILEEPSSDPCYPIRAARGKNRWAACLQSSRPGMSNSNDHAGRKSIKNCLRGRQTA